MQKCSSTVEPAVESAKHSSNHNSYEETSCPMWQQLFDQQRIDLVRGFV